MKRREFLYMTGTALAVGSKLAFAEEAVYRKWCLIRHLGFADPCAPDEAVVE